MSRSPCNLITNALIHPSQEKKLQTHFYFLPSLPPFLSSLFLPLFHSLPISLLSFLPLSLPLFFCPQSGHSPRREGTGKHLVASRYLLSFLLS